MCLHYLRASCNFFYEALGATRGKSIQRLCGDCTGIVQCQCSCRAVSATSAQKSYGARVGIGLRMVPVRGLCNATYDMISGYGLTIFFRFVKLLAKPNRRGRGARKSVRKSHSRLLPPQGGLAEAARKGGYGQDTGSVGPSQAKCELDITDKKATNWVRNSEKPLRVTNGAIWEPWEREPVAAAHGKWGHHCCIYTRKFKLRLLTVFSSKHKGLQ